MLLQTNSYIVPRDKRVEHARLLRRFRQTLLRLGCDHFEVYEQSGANWSSNDNSGRFVQIMRFRDRKHQLAVQNAERGDAAAQALLKEFCELINLPYQQQQGLFAVGFYTSFMRMPEIRQDAPAGTQPALPQEEAAPGEIEDAADQVEDADGATSVGGTTNAVNAVENPAIHSSEEAVDERAAEDLMGEESSGEETSGEETSGEEMSGEEMSGEKTSDEERSGVDEEAEESDSDHPSPLGELSADHGAERVHPHSDFSSDDESDFDEPGRLPSDPAGSDDTAEHPTFPFNS